jgi:hypothetical protein
VQDYLNDSRLYTAALEELQGQLSKIESELSRSKAKPSELMKRVLENANTLKFKQYIEGSLPPPPQPNLAAGIDENIRLLSVLCSEMSELVARIEFLQGNLVLKLQSFSEKRSELQQEGGGETQHMDSGSTWEQAANDALLAAGTVDALQQDLVLIVSSSIFCFSMHIRKCKAQKKCWLCTIFYSLQRKVTEAVSILTPSAEVSSYVAVLKVQPYFPTSLLEEILSWKRESSK